MSVMETESDARPCANSECDNEYVEPELDGDHLYYECEECGFAFGYQRIEGTKIEGNCSIGVPESVRRAASSPMEKALAQQEGPKLIGLTIPVRKD